jgi:hypothetical protein
MDSKQRGVEIIVKLRRHMEEDRKESYHEQGGNQPKKELIS